MRKDIENNMFKAKSMTNHRHLICFLILKGVVLTTHAQNVSSPLFYHSNQLRCNCDQNQQCDVKDGTCPGGKCASPYFGINCQHVNVSLKLTSPPTNVPVELLDSNDETCLSQWNGQAIFEMIDSVFIWIYIFRKSTLPIKPQLKNYPSWKGGKIFDVLKINDHSVLLKLCTPDRSPRLELSNLPTDTCSLEVSLGRNLAITSTLLNVTGSAATETKKIIDGNDLTSCFQFTVDDYGGKLWWRFRLRHEATVNRISILSNAGTACGHWYFQVLTWNMHGKTFHSIILDKTTRHEAIVDKIYSPMVNQVDITLSRSYPDSNCPQKIDIKICEVYIYGEFHCPPNKYGSICEKDLPANCNGELCDPDWGCPPTCNQKSVSQDCRFRYGEHCEFACPDGCGGLGDCDNGTGACVHGCRAGYAPPSCRTSCLPGTFQVNCSKTCYSCEKNKTTHEYACDPASGECLLGCGFGFRGDYCESINVVDVLVSKHWGLFVVGYGIVLMILIYKSLVRRELEDPTEEEEEEGEVEQGKGIVVVDNVDEVPQQGVVTEPLPDCENVETEHKLSTSEHERKGDIHEMPNKSFWTNVFGVTASSSEHDPKEEQHQQQLLKESTRKVSIEAQLPISNTQLKAEQHQVANKLNRENIVEANISTAEPTAKGNQHQLPDEINSKNIIGPQRSSSEPKPNNEEHQLPNGPKSLQNPSNARGPTDVLRTSTDLLPTIQEAKTGAKRSSSKKKQSGVSDAMN